jgi:SAM-dependent methyltransferase
MALAKRLVPAGLFRRLDPFEAAIQDFVRGVAGKTPSGAAVLDAGAGECRYQPLFSHVRYVAVDFAQGDPSWNYRLLDVIGRLEQLPFLAATFDVVLSIVVLEHTPEPQRAIEEFARVVKPGGKIYLVIPHMWEEHQKPYDFFRFTSGGIRYLMESAGFQVTAVEPVGGFFWQLGRRLMAVLSFTQQSWRWIFFPLLAPIFGFALPLCCYYLDRIDHDRSYTLGYICEGSKG